METVFLAAMACSNCVPGERQLSPCTPDHAAVCWPCAPGSSCTNGTQRACLPGLWSAGGASWCEPCSSCPTGWLRAGDCTAVKDTVCAACPAGYGCDGSRTMAECPRGLYSVDGLCVACPPNHTTPGAGAVSIAECVCESPQRHGCDRCGAGAWFVGDACRPCPAGYSCEGYVLAPCPEDTFSLRGQCAPCAANSHTPSGAAVETDCACDAGFVRGGRACVACGPGTVYSPDIGCASCPAGEFCLGKVHHEPCPADMYATGGSAMCAACRPNSECRAPPCVDAANCTCMDGYIDVRGECRRCPPGTRSVVACEPCDAGMECLGGADVRECGIGTYSGGNRSACARCTQCPELTAARCNRTHDSVCDTTTFPFAVITVRQRYGTMIGGDLFRLYSLVYASSIPRAQVDRLCDAARCVECFQGMCPPGGALRPANYELALVLSMDVGRLSNAVETLTQTDYLHQAGITAMSKLTEEPFTLISSVEHTVVCPQNESWNGQSCVSGKSRTWLGLAVAGVLLATLGACGYRQQKARWARVSQVAEVVDGN